MEFFKDAVLGFVVTRADKPKQYGPVKPDEPAAYLSCRPIAVAWDGEMDDADDKLYPDDTVVGVLPAPPGSYAVYGLVGNSYKLLGYEFPGAFIPNWEEVLQEEITRQEKKGKKP
jgi:hypothetical protein